MFHFRLFKLMAEMPMSLLETNEKKASKGGTALSSDVTNIKELNSHLEDKNQA